MIKNSIGEFMLNLIGFRTNITLQGKKVNIILSTWIIREINSIFLGKYPSIISYRD